jgi:hypothetical protein
MMTKTRQTHRPSTMTVAQAWTLFKPELMDMADNWTDEDTQDEPSRLLTCLDIESDSITQDVLNEVENMSSRDWCVGRYKTAALVLLASGGRLDALDPASSYSRTMQVRVLLGTTWLV